MQTRIFEAPPTYEDALKHRSVPPRQRPPDASGGRGGGEGFDNLGFATEAEVRLSSLKLITQGLQLLIGDAAADRG